MDINAEEEEEPAVTVTVTLPPKAPPPEIEYGAGTTFVAIFEDENGVEYIRGWRRAEVAPLS